MQTTSSDPSMADQLADLRVETQCDAGMARGEIAGLVRKAVEDAGLLADHDEIEAETDRIWTSFGSLAAPKLYDVGSDGTVRDWRRPDTTPDRGPEVGTTVHTITGDDQRFSGAGASDGDGERFPVPSDSDFRGKLYRDAPELADIAEGLISKHGFLSELINAEIRYYWRRKTGVSKGRVKIGYCKRASDLLGHFSGADFLIWLSATTARDGKFTPRQVEAAIFHQLLHIETDDEGNFISARHDFEGFAQEIRHYGTWTEDLKLAVPAFKAAEQMGLFDLDDDGIEDDDEDEGVDYGGRVFEGALIANVTGVGPEDGAGVLIHADGTPMTADEIEAMERHELADDPSEDEEEDILADPKVI